MVSFCVPLVVVVVLDAELHASSSETRPPLVRTTPPAPPSNPMKRLLVGFSVPARTVHRGFERSGSLMAPSRLPASLSSSSPLSVYGGDAAQYSMGPWIARMGCHE